MAMCTGSISPRKFHRLSDSGEEFRWRQPARVHYEHPTRFSVPSRSSPTSPASRSYSRSTCHYLHHRRSPLDLRNHRRPPSSSFYFLYRSPLSEPHGSQVTQPLKSATAGTEMLTKVAPVASNSGNVSQPSDLDRAVQIYPCHPKIVPSSFCLKPNHAT